MGLRWGALELRRFDVDRRRVAERLGAVRFGARFFRAFREEARATVLVCSGSTVRRGAPEEAGRRFPESRRVPALFFL